MSKNFIRIYEVRSSENGVHFDKLHYRGASFGQAMKAFWEVELYPQRSFQFNSYPCEVKHNLDKMFGKKDDL